MSKAILDTAEVIHDYMRNGDRSTSREECITWIARLIQEVSQQSPSATVEKKFDIDKAELEQAYQDAVQTAMKFGEEVLKLRAEIEQLHSQQPTVDVGDKK